MVHETQTQTKRNKKTKKTLKNFLIVAMRNIIGASRRDVEPPEGGSTVIGPSRRCFFVFFVCVCVS